MDLTMEVEITGEEREREGIVLKKLEHRGIPFVLHRHPRVFTCETHDGVLPKEIVEESMMLKNLFLERKKKGTYLLVTAASDTQVRLNELSKLMNYGSGNLRFASEDKLGSILHVGGGSVTPLALLFVEDLSQIECIFESDINTRDSVVVHPMHNAASIVLRGDHLLQFLQDELKDCKIHLKEL